MTEGRSHTEGTESTTTQGRGCMKLFVTGPLILIAALAIAGAAYGQVPAGTWSGNDTSDTNQNTGMGTGALGTGASNAGTDNTAAGYHALFSNTTNGNFNTASGWNALVANTNGSGNTVSG